MLVFCMCCYLCPFKRLVTQPHLGFKVISGNAAADAAATRFASHPCTSWHLVLNLYFTARTTFRRSDWSDGKRTGIIRGPTSCGRWNEWSFLQSRPRRRSRSMITGLRVSHARHTRRSETDLPRLGPRMICTLWLVLRQKWTVCVALGCEWKTVITLEF